MTVSKNGSTEGRGWVVFALRTSFEIVTPTFLPSRDVLLDNTLLGVLAVYRTQEDAEAAAKRGEGLDDFVVREIRF